MAEQADTATQNPMKKMQELMQKAQKSGKPDDLKAFQDFVLQVQAGGKPSTPPPERKRNEMTDEYDRIMKDPKISPKDKQKAVTEFMLKRRQQRDQESDGKKSPRDAVYDAGEEEKKADKAKAEREALQGEVRGATEVLETVNRKIVLEKHAQLRAGGSEQVKQAEKIESLAVTEYIKTEEFKKIRINGKPVPNGREQDFAAAMMLAGRNAGANSELKKAFDDAIVAYHAKQPEAWDAPAPAPVVSAMSNYERLNPKEKQAVDRAVALRCEIARDDSTNGKDKSDLLKGLGLPIEKLGDDYHKINKIDPKVEEEVYNKVLKEYGRLSTAQTLDKFMQLRPREEDDEVSKKKFQAALVRIQTGHTSNGGKERAILKEAFKMEMAKMVDSQANFVKWRDEALQFHSLPSNLPRVIEFFDRMQVQGSKHIVDGPYNGVSFCDDSGNVIPLNTPSAAISGPGKGITN